MLGLPLKTQAASPLTWGGGEGGGLVGWCPPGLGPTHL